jgi:hypothetical protein
VVGGTVEGRVGSVVWEDDDFLLPGRAVPGTVMVELVIPELC